MKAQKRAAGLWPGDVGVLGRAARREEGLSAVRKERPRLIRLCAVDGEGWERGQMRDDADGGGHDEAASDASDRPPRHSPTVDNSLRHFAGDEGPHLRVLSGGGSGGEEGHDLAEDARPLGHRRPDHPSLQPGPDTTTGGGACVTARDLRMIGL